MVGYLIIFVCSGLSNLFLSSMVQFCLALNNLILVYNSIGKCILICPNIVYYQSDRILPNIYDVSGIARYFPLLRKI